MRTRRLDPKLARLAALTGIRRRESLRRLGRLADIVDAPTDSTALTDWLGAGHAVAVVAGTCLADGRCYVPGDVFVTRPFEPVEPVAATVLVATAANADTLRCLLATRPRHPSADTIASRASLISRNGTSYADAGPP